MIEKEARLKVINLSRLEEIKDLRTVWPHEALDFTPWLSQDDNISLLADAVEMDITVDETESSVGDFNVDIFASETGTDRKIIIENQLEDTNHDHLIFYRRTKRFYTYKVRVILRHYKILNEKNI